MTVWVSSGWVGYFCPQYRVRDSKPSRKLGARVLAKVPENLKNLTGTGTKIA